MNGKLSDSRQGNFWFEKKACLGLKQEKQSKPWLKGLKHFQHRWNWTNTEITKSQNNLMEASQPDTIRTKSAGQIRCMFQSLFIPCTPEYCAYSYNGYRISLWIFFLCLSYRYVHCLWTSLYKSINQAVEAVKDKYDIYSSLDCLNSALQR